MPSSLAELQRTEKALQDKLQRLINLRSHTANPSPSLNGDIHMTRLRLQDVRSKINAYNNR